MARIDALHTLKTVLEACMPGGAALCREPKDHINTKTVAKPIVSWNRPCFGPENQDAGSLCVYVVFGASESICIYIYTDISHCIMLYCYALLVTNTILY